MSRPIEQTLSVDGIHDIVAKSDKNSPPASVRAFVAAIVLGIPTWLTVFPMTVAYNLGKTAVRTIMKKKPHPDLAPIDSGIQASEVLPRKDRKFDLVVYGATGFTGGLAVRYLAKTYGVGKSVKWAISGRSKSKLEALKKDLAEQLGLDEVLQLEIIIADSSKPETLPNLARDTRVVLAAAGPFAKYGSPVVECCAKFGTHYVDITGEKFWIRDMLLQWDSTAQATGAKMISACGNDCVPWDLTVMKLESALPKGETLKEVTCLDNCSGVVSGGTISTMLMTMEGVTEGGPSSKHPFDPALKLPDGSKSQHSIKSSSTSFVTRWKEAGHYHGWYLGYVFFVPINSVIIKRSTALRQQTADNVLYKEYRVFPDFKSAFVDWFQLLLLGTMLGNPLTRFLMTRFVLPNPGEGPSMDDMENNYHLAVTGYGVGSKGSVVESVLYFPKDPGYLEASRMVSESALCLAFDEDKLPVSGGGFFTSSTGMGDALLDRLVKTGSYFASRLVKSGKQE